jgi:hypothetical protein
MAIIGAVSVLSLLLLLGHIISVSFLPLCLSALNAQTEPTAHHTSTGHSDICFAMGGPDRKSNMTAVQSNTGIEVDLERARALEERRTRARALELSRQVSNHTSVLRAEITSPQVKEK